MLFSKLLDVGVELEALRFLDRDSLDAVELCNRLLRHFLLSNSTLLAFRRLQFLSLEVYRAWNAKRRSPSQITVKIDRDDVPRKTLKPGTVLEGWDYLLRHLRHAYVVRYVQFSWMPISQCFAERLIEMKNLFRTEHVIFYSVDLETSPDSFLALISCSCTAGMQKLYVKLMKANAAHINVRLLDGIAVKRITEVRILGAVPIGGYFYDVPEDSILRYCFEHDWTDERVKQLRIANVRLSASFFEDFVEACRRAPGTFKLRLTVTWIPGKQLVGTASFSTYLASSTSYGTSLFDFNRAGLSLSVRVSNKEFSAYLNCPLRHLTPPSTG